jgi:hypothetical protein
MSTRRQGQNDEKVLDEIRALARLDRILLTSHAMRRMDERGATEVDVRMALLTSSAALRQADRPGWRIEGGVDSDGDALTMICDLGADVLVVTLF